MPLVVNGIFLTRLANGRSCGYHTAELQTATKPGRNEEVV